MLSDRFDEVSTRVVERLLLNVAKSGRADESLCWILLSRSRQVSDQTKKLILDDVLHRLESIHRHSHPSSGLRLRPGDIDLFAATLHDLAYDRDEAVKARTDKLVMWLRKGPL